jgi:hypothetical protein
MIAAMIGEIAESDLLGDITDVDRSIEHRGRALNLLLNQEFDLAPTGQPPGGELGNKPQAMRLGSFQS